MSLVQCLIDGERRSPARTASHFMGRRRTWQEVTSRVARLAGGLRGLGVHPGDRVAVSVHNSDRVLELYFAVLWCGAVLVPVDARRSPREIAHILADATPRALLHDDGLARHAVEVARGQGSETAVIDIGQAHGQVSRGVYERLIAGPAPLAPPGPAGTDLACLLYTSGTTGPPKGAMLTHGNLIEAARLSMAEAIDPGTVFLHLLPVIAAGALVSLIAVTMGGGSHVFAQRFSHHALAEGVSAQGATATYLVPAALQGLLPVLRASRDRLHALRLVRYGGSPIAVDLLLQLMDVLPEVTFWQCYGLTETAGIVTSLKARGRASGPALAPRLDSVGSKLETLQVAILDGEGRALAPGKSGEIAVRGPTLMQGYWSGAGHPPTGVVDGWFCTGDVGYFDERGDLRLVDRLSDLIVTASRNVHPAEVEAAIMRHPDVHMCAVIGVWDAGRGEVVCAIVVPVPGATLEARHIRAHCAATLAPYQRPRRIEIRAEPLPLGPTGKVLKAQLRRALRPAGGC